MDKQFASDISQDVAPDIDRAIARMKLFCDEQHAERPPGHVGAGIYYSDVRALLADRQATHKKIADWIERLETASSPGQVLIVVSWMRALIGRP